MRSLGIGFEKGVRKSPRGRGNADTPTLPFKPVRMREHCDGHGIEEVRHLMNRFEFAPQLDGSCEQATRRSPRRKEAIHLRGAHSASDPDVPRDEIDQQITLDYASGGERVVGVVTNIGVEPEGLGLRGFFRHRHFR